MQHSHPFILIVAFILTACAPAIGVQPATPTPSLTGTSLPTLTPSATVTPKPTATPTAPLLPPMPEGGINTIIDGDRTYALNEAGDKIGRYDTENNSWQERYTLPQVDENGKQKYEGWIISDESIDIKDITEKGKTTNKIVESVFTGPFDKGYGIIATSNGCITRNRKLEISDGVEKTIFDLFEMTYVYKDGIIVIEFSGLEERLNTGGTVKGVHSGDCVRLNLMASALSSGDFPNPLKQSIKEYQQWNDLKADLVTGDNNPFLSFQELENKLNSLKPGDALNLEFLTLVDQIKEKLKD